MRKEILEIAEKRLKWVEANRENGFEEGLKKMLTDLYPDNAHFIYELLQNAEDAHAHDVRFILQDDRLDFEHDGERLFSIDDVNAITGLGFSTKRNDITNIGKFGVGFKAVYAYTETPQVESGNIRFRIHDMVVPYLDDLLDSPAVGKQTRFILPFDSLRKSREQATKEIKQLLTGLDATTLLFLKHIRKIEYLLPDSSLGYIERIELGGGRYKFVVQQPEHFSSSSWFFKFDREVRVNDEEEQVEKSCRVAVSFALSQVENKADVGEAKISDISATPDLELKPIDHGAVCIYFPAKKETSNLRFHVHAPFASTVARDSVRECEGNAQLRDHLSNLLAESMTVFRDQGLLTVRTLALLPNDKDNLSKFYLPLMTRLAREFQEQNLVPLKRNGHGAASGIIRGSKALSDIITDDDLVTLLGSDTISPRWAANPPQIHQREDNFLSMLGIKQWNPTDLVKAIVDSQEETVEKWMSRKDDNWHRDFYKILFDAICAAAKSPCSAINEQIMSLKMLRLIRCSDDYYRKGSECFFSTGNIEHDSKFPRVAKGVYCTDKKDDIALREFFENMGVRYLDERIEIEYVLKERYSCEETDIGNSKPRIDDVRLFVEFAETHPSDVNIFCDYCIFKLENGKWAKPNRVYLDLPFLDTSLNVYYQTQQSQAKCWALSKEYVNIQIDPVRIGDYARRCGAITKLSVELFDKDYFSVGILNILKLRNENVAKLIWKTCIIYEKSDLCIWKKQSKKNRRYKNFAPDVDSSIATILKTVEWVPQVIGPTVNFVKPCEAVAEQLPNGFVYQNDWEWLKALEFGANVNARIEANRLERERQSQDYRRKEEVALSFGFESPEEAENIAQLKNRDPEAFKMVMDKLAECEKRTAYPSRSVQDPERRQVRLSEQIALAPDKEYEKRERSVRITIGSRDQPTWLRNQYTNDDDQMFCQICKHELPFRKRDGTLYFVARAVLTRKYLPKELDAQYLALCPLCDAKYCEFVLHDDAIMTTLRDRIVSSDLCEIPISLGDEKTSIRFVETHYHDLKKILEEMGQSAPRD